MRKLILFMHVSLDGFVAGPEGELEWISVGSDTFELADRVTANADTALYGRKTYEIMESYWPAAADRPGATKHDINHSRWYNSVDKVVVSGTLESRPLSKMNVIATDISTAIRQLKQLDGKDIVMFGSPSVAYFLMQHQLIDDYWFFINPVLLGAGIPMFKDIKDTIKLSLEECKVFASGVVGLHYRKC